MADVKLHLVAGISLPQTVLLPKAIASSAGVKRSLTLGRREVTVPAAVASYLQNDARYRGFFDSNVVEGKTVVRPVPKQVVEDDDDDAAQPNSGQSLNEPGGAAPTLTPDGSSPTTPNDGEPPSELGVTKWAESMTVPALRKFAGANNVTLTDEDTKKEHVVAKLRAAMPAAELVETPKE